MFDAPADIEKKIAKAVTDTDGEVRFDWEEKPGLSNLLEIYSSLSGETPDEVASRYSRYGELKNDLAALLDRDPRPDASERYEELARLTRRPRTRSPTRGADKASLLAGSGLPARGAAMGLT